VGLAHPGLAQFSQPPRSTGGRFQVVRHRSASASLSSAPGVTASSKRQYRIKTQRRVERTGHICCPTLVDPGSTAITVELVIVRRLPHMPSGEHAASAPRGDVTSMPVADGPTVAAKPVSVTADPPSSPSSQASASWTPRCKRKLRESGAHYTATRSCVADLRPHPPQGRR